jgi:RNA-directed DNA polymerase
MGNHRDSSARSYDKELCMLNGLGRVREAAKKDSSTQFTALLHHITVDLLIRAYKTLNHTAKAGVDGVTWADYAEDYISSIRDLHARLHRGAYRAKPSKRLYLEKPDGGKRPIGIAALEDKIVQQAMVWLLEAIYEDRFMGFNYGFRPGRQPHEALDAVTVAIKQRKVSWVLDADIESFFDNIDHEKLMQIIEKRIQDRRIHRLIRKWLRAGVSEDGEWSKTKVGTPQGAVISPLLANIYLHHVLDLWVDTWRKENARGEVYIVRYADDFVMGFQYKSDAVALQTELRERLKEFNLTLHKDKTRLIEFGRFAAKNRKDRGDGKPETFTFLGFTHICSEKRCDGRFTVRRETARAKLNKSIQRIKVELRNRMHWAIEEQGRWLHRVLVGHMNYYAVPENPGPGRFRHQLAKMWCRTLRRRSQKGRKLNWTTMNKYVFRWLPKVKVCHPYPEQRFCV